MMVKLSLFAFVTVFLLCALLAAGCSDCAGCRGHGAAPSVENGGASGSEAAPGDVATTASRTGAAFKEVTAKRKKLQAQGLSQAVFAGGCFWCIEPSFEKLDGVEAVLSGYTGGQKPRPTYEEVASHRTEHLEAVEVFYDPKRISYETLLEVFWRNIDPTDPGGQFVDRGEQYRSAVFVRDEAQRKAAEASKRSLGKTGRFDKPIVTEIREAGTFYPAEDYHQDYYKKSPANYYRYRSGSGRDAYIEKVWGSK